MEPVLSCMELNGLLINGLEREHRFGENLVLYLLIEIKEEN